MLMRILCCCALMAGAAFPLPARAETAVSIVKGDDPDRMVAEALELIGGLKGLVKDGQTIVIKPNLVSPSKAESPGLMTDVRVVAALVKEIQRVGKCRIVVAEGSAAEWQPKTMGTMEAFKQNGYHKIAESYGVELVDLNSAPRVKVKGAGLGFEEYDYPRLLKECDLLIDVPVMKSHLLTGVTLGTKNLFGLMPLPKAQFHSRIDGVLCDLVAIHKPGLVVLDALTATEGQGPLAGTPVRMDLVIAGRDVVAVDSVATAVMGIEPTRIRHIALAARNGLGEGDLSKIAIKGKTIEAVRRPFILAKWEAQLTIPRTEAMVKKIAELADRRDTHWHGGQAAGMEYRFNPERLKPDTAKYPVRKSHGFMVIVGDDEANVEFTAPYETAYEENAQAAVEEMTRWIEENLGWKGKPVSSGKKAATTR